MKASQLIEKLQNAIKTHGDHECLIEVVDGVCYLAPVDEVSFENREGYGESFALII
jgi:hypothetical protein